MVGHAPAFFDRVSISQRRLRDVGVSSTQFCAVFSFLSQQRLDKAFRGIQPLTTPQADQLDVYITELEELVASVAPLTIDWRNVMGVKATLEQRRKGREITCSTMN